MINIYISVNTALKKYKFFSLKILKTRFSKILTTRNRRGTPTVSIKRFAGLAIASFFSSELCKPRFLFLSRFLLAVKNLHCRKKAGILCEIFVCIISYLVLGIFLRATLRFLLKTRSRLFYNN